MKRFISVLFGSMLLAGCGGGSSGGNAATSVVPSIVLAPPTAAPQSSPTALTPFAAIRGRIALTAGSSATSGAYVNVPGRGAVYFSLGTPSVDANLSYVISDTVPAGLPSFDGSKIVIGAVAVTSDVTEQLSGTLALAINKSQNGSYAKYQIASYVPPLAGTTSTWSVDQATQGQYDPSLLAVNSPEVGYQLVAGKVFYIVVYGNA